MFSAFVLLNIITSCQSKVNQGDNLVADKNGQKMSVTNPQKEVIMENLKRPWSMAFLNADEAIVAEKDGDLLVVNLSTKTRKIIKGFPNDLADSLLIFAKDYPLGTYPTGLKDLKENITQEFSRSF